ncbi:uncharacterized protein LOC144671577 [Cetorhinus maximus]
MEAIKRLVLRPHRQRNLFRIIATRGETPNQQFSISQTVPIEGAANIMMNKCVTDDQRPMLKSGLKVICQGSTCTGNYRASFNKSGCYYLCIQDISHPTDASKENLHLLFGKAEFTELIPVTFGSDDVCPTPDPSVTPAVDHQKQHNTTEGARPGFGIGIGVTVGFFVGVLLSGIVVCVFQRRQKWNRHSNNQNEATHDVPLTGVTCPGEARGLVTTAPEHQDGAAGEQNLLGNGTVQH